MPRSSARNWATTCGPTRRPICSRRFPGATGCVRRAFIPGNLGVNDMRTLTVTATAALVLAAGLAGPAHAKGCLKGAAVGGLAGHMAHHGVLGAAGGCAVGHHMASKHE